MLTQRWSQDRSSLQIGTHLLKPPFAMVYLLKSTLVWILSHLNLQILASRHLNQNQLLSVQQLKHKCHQRILPRLVEEKYHHLDYLRRPHHLEELRHHPPRSNQQNRVDQGTQGQPECNQHDENSTNQLTDQGKGFKGKRGKKKASKEPTPHPGTSTGTSTEDNTTPRTDFTSRNLGTGRPMIQCTACGEYNHWSRACPYNYCTTCKDNTHATHMYNASRPSPVICIFCHSMAHRSANCANKPWDNREQPCSTPDAL